MRLTKDEINQIKDDVSLTRAAAFYNIRVTRGNTRKTGAREKCPLCESHSGFVTSNDKYWQCYSCNQKGDVFSLVGLCTGGNEFSKVLKLSSQSLKKQETQRLTGMAAVFKLYQDQIKVEHLDYFEDRGIKLKPNECGYAPSATFLQENGYTKEQLDELGLWSDRQCELFSDRVIFPIKNQYGFITHFQGRALDLDAKLRWKGSRGGLHSIHEVIFNAHKRFVKSHPLFITEGITDTKSLETLGFQAMGTLGLGMSLTNYASMLAGFTLYFIYDNTQRSIGQNNAGQDVSWSAMLPSIINLHVTRGPGKIYCVRVPQLSGVEDVNDFANYLDWNTKAFANYVVKNKQTIGQFALENSDSLELIGKAVRVNREPKELEQYWMRVRSEKGSIKEYLLELL